jgi:hypothetical protein
VWSAVAVKEEAPVVMLLTKATAKQIYALPFTSHEERLLPDPSIEVFHNSEGDFVLCCEVSDWYPFT